MKNRIFKKNYISILSFLLFVSSSIDKKESELILSSIFSDSIVLQQMYDTALWGKSKPNEIIDNKVRVSSSMIKYPKHLRYGWKNWTVGTLFNKEGLPVSSFNFID